MSSNYRSLSCGFCLMLVFLFVLMAGNSWAGVDSYHYGEGWETGWLKLQEVQAGASVNDRIKNVNEYFNRIPRVSDREVWGRADYWASVTEFLQRAKGDCEDFAIAKYYTLRKLGIPDSDLRLAYGKLLNPGRGIEPHMVLLYMPQGVDAVVLDNIDMRIQSLKKRNDLVIQYAFNSRWLWEWSEGDGQRLIGNADVLPQWKLMKQNNTLEL